ncbi:hypothetical protein PG994_003296 [Apiospora phragmitis]|uniref:Uncharacterized protein n=1 Tax=Apiospora phragmitis TaxID=2905665 RepID=A0ABR1W1I0_9PEZI
MQFFSYAAILALSSIAVSATSINIFSGTACADDDFIKNFSASAGCHKLQSGVKAFDVRTLSGKCTVTVYSDASCSDNAKGAGVDKCVSRSAGWKSYSVDGC